MESFEPERYAGRWYEHYRTRMGSRYTRGTSCNTREFWPSEDETGDLDLLFRSRNNRSLTYSAGSGTLFYCDEATPEIEDGWTCKATMGSGTKKSPFPIWKTDYENWMMSYRCSQGSWYNPFMLFGLAKWERFAMSTREPEMRDELFDEMYDVVAEALPDFNIDGSFFAQMTTVTQGDDCEYSWKYEDGEIVE